MAKRPRYANNSVTFKLQPSASNCVTFNLGQKATLREQPNNLGQKATLREQLGNLQPSTS
ncbi:MAG: hypothetical protein F6J90_02870 [Moorea sp. SIOASIH]|uniref:hypothetical protein n=1 Tax=Moorena sp. SIOASIH TaxID=2607817 RepID=UPI0013BBF061|nr:hypothetical protein [Moorena sp. SIOASIH]NEO35301.1 hypothetical protein [Moorena sp. SIOASIH]